MIFHILYGILGCFLAVALLFAQDNLDGRRHSTTSEYAIVSFLTGLMFFFISLKVNVSADVVLLSIFVICCHFLILNRIRSAKKLEKMMLFIIGITAFSTVLNQIDSSNIHFFFAYPILLFLGLTILKYMAKFFISSDVLRWDEVFLASICSVFVIKMEGLMLASYIILIALFYLIWGIICRFVNKRSYIFLIPAIEASVMTCILLKKFAMLVQHFIQ